MKIEQQNAAYFSEYINNTLGEAAHDAAEINKGKEKLVEKTYGDLKGDVSRIRG